VFQKGSLRASAVGGECYKFAMQYCKQNVSKAIYKWQARERSKKLQAHIFILL